MPRHVSRRAFLGAAGAAHAMLALRAAPAFAQETAPFGRPMVIDLARNLAAAPFATPEPAVPQPLLDLSFAEYQAFRARSETWLFADPPTGFAVEPLPSGFIYREPVELFVVRDQQAFKVNFTAENFDLPAVEGLPLDAPLEFAGFRGWTSLNASDLSEPFIVFAGASYFQAVARGQVFGLSARGLAIRTGEQDGEEFPFFRAFWLEEPADGRMVVHALLDSPSVTGAYRFTIRPGDQTVIDTEASLFARAAIDRIGLAPLTSMYLFDHRARGAYDDPRLSVHDSDGLAIWNGRDERIWRPLNNPRLLQISAFADAGPRGFGLIQREKRSSEYEDLESRFDRRPSLWVEPIGDWGAGSVVLVEIPSAREIHDNIVCFWRPEAPIAAGGETTFTYRLTFGWDAPIPGGMMRVTRTLEGASPREGWRRLIVDYSSPGDGTSASLAEVIARAQTSVGAIEDVKIVENPSIGGWRVSFDLNPDGQDSAELRLDMLRGEQPAGEVWVHRWNI